MKSWFDDMSPEEFNLWSETVELFFLIALWISLGAGAMFLCAYDLTILAVPTTYLAGYLARYLRVQLAEHADNMQKFYKLDHKQDNDPEDNDDA